MSYKKFQARYHNRQRTHEKAISLPVLAGIAGMIAVLIVVLIVVAGKVNASGGGVGNVPVGYGSLHHPKGSCGNAGQASCGSVDPGWFPVPSESMNTVTLAITQSNDFTSMQSRFGYTQLDTPALVHAYNAHTGQDYYDDDHWVVSVRNTSGLRCGIFDFVYDRANHRMRFASFGILPSQDTHSRLAFPYITAMQAREILQNQRKLDIATGTQPELIFFPIDASYPVLTSPIHSWTGGGESAMNPMWYLVGTNSQSYFVGADLKIYNSQELPVTTHP